MAAIHLSDLPDDLLAALQSRAAAHQRPIEAEIVAILRIATEQQPPLDEPLQLVMAQPASGADWSRASIYGDDGR